MTIVLTGANRGLGYEMALALAGNGNLMPTQIRAHEGARTCPM